jgi:large subunit ribosomal protein L22
MTEENKHKKMKEEKTAGAEEKKHKKAKTAEAPEKKDEAKVEGPEKENKTQAEDKAEKSEGKNSQAAPAEAKAEDKKEEKKEKPKAVKVKKSEAVANGKGLHVSKKQAVYICAFIKGKEIDKAIADLEQVMKLKKAVPFKGEIPHRKGNIMSGRYPVKASKEFINMLKALKGNSVINGLELEKTRISIASASWAMRPMRSGGRKAKRTNVLLIAREMEAKK